MPNRDSTKTTAGATNSASENRVDHAGHRIEVRTPDMAGRPVVICSTCNVRLAQP